MNTNDTTTTAPALIDFEQLESACGGDAELKRELMDMYFGQADTIIAGLKTAVAEKSVPDVNHLSHKLAGSSLACGLSAVVPALRRMEHAAKAGHLDGAEESLAETVKYLELTREAVREHIGPVNSP